MIMKITMNIMMDEFIDNYEDNNDDAAKDDGAHLILLPTGGHEQSNSLGTNFQQGS